MNFTQEEKKQIKEAVLAAEKKTNGEIVPVIVKQSDSYPSSHFRWSFILSFIALSLTYWIELDNSIYFLHAFLIGSVLGYLIAFIPWFKKLVLTKDQLEEEFKQRAIESFLMNGVTETKNRNGVQLFISAFEHKAMIIADIGIQKKINNQVWSKIINQMIPHLKNKNYKEGIVDAIGSIGEILATYFPEDHDDQDELPNKIIIDV